MMHTAGNSVQYRRHFFNLHNWLLVLLFVFYGQGFSGHLFGVNLASAEFGNQYPGVYGSDYTYPDVSSLDYYAAKGLKLIRLPFRWERMQRELYSELDSLELQRMDAFIDGVSERGMWVIPDMHNYARRVMDDQIHIIGSQELSVRAFADFWRRFAEHYRDEASIWGYDLCNEPHDMGQYSWFDAAQAAIDAIREVDTATAVIVSGDDWSSAQRWLSASAHLGDLIDPYDNIIFQAHQYFDRDASGRYQHSYDDENASPETGVERVKPFVQWLQENNFRGFVGEYGIPDDDPRWLVTLENFLAYLEENGVSGTYWAGGPWWGDYPLSCEPKNGQHRPHMSVLKQYTGVTSVSKSSGTTAVIGKTTGIQLNKQSLFIPHYYDGLTLYRLNGRAVFSFDTHGHHTFPVPLRSGTYIVRMHGDFSAQQYGTVQIVQ
ncbi:glycoside hydrolase family 5 protein [Chitinispirillales bacterium ANBcel5]|uniref:glycoside hydrolase family 5 protein n=1 Tax=Cellulosispirillum alkaliphilum TaxID=3039283 RepID=UPI002A4FC912|nr:glycoside hydrolase family 5 protein [Chitinispirillales bacterium ANBcel5]